MKIFWDCLVRNVLKHGAPLQVKELREQALSYRRRAWGTNFSRDHLSQLLSEHNALWEPTETPTTFDLCHSAPRVEALDLHR